MTTLTEIIIKHVERKGIHIDFHSCMGLDDMEHYFVRAYNADKEECARSYGSTCEFIAMFSIVVQLIKNK